MPEVEATYTTSDKIRTEAGFQNNTDIQDSDIDSQRIRAYAHINSRIGARYALPVKNQDNYSGSSAEELLSSIELLLGSAFMLIQEYGNEALGTDKDGYRKKDYAMKMLDDIVKREMVLFDSNGAEMTTNAKYGIEPGSLKPEAHTPTEDATFSAGMKF